MPTAYQTFVQSQLPLAYYPFNELVGSIAKDASGNGYDAAAQNVILNGAIGPDLGPAYGFNGVNSLVTPPASLLTALNSAGDCNTLTVAMWFKIPILANWNDNAAHRMLSFFDTGPVPTQQFGMRKRPNPPDNTWDAFITLNNNSEFYGFTPGTQPLDWTHVVFTFAGYATTMYVNGVLFQTFNVGKGFLVPMTLLAIGASTLASPPTQSFNGSIAHVAFWPSALSGDTVARLANPLVSTTISVLPASSNTGTQYQIATIDPATGLTTGVFDGASFYELRYSRKLNDIGVVAFTLPSTPANRALFNLDTMIEVYRTDPTNKTRQMIVEDTYLTRLTHRFRQGDDEKFLVGGYSLNHLLKRRIIDPAEDSSASLTGYSSKSGPADVVIQQYVYQQMGAGASQPRQIPNLFFGPISSVGLTISKNLRYTELFQEMYDIAIAGGVDFLISRQMNNILIMNIQVIGSDKTQKNNFPIRPWVGLSPIRGNLTDPSFMLDRQDERTFIYAMGQGQADARAKFTMSAAGYSDSVYNRWEAFVDCRSNDKSDATGLITDAVAELFKFQPKKTFSYTLLGGEGGNIYRLDWDLGDIVTAFWDEVSVDLRVWGVEVVVNEQGEQIKIDARQPMLN